MKLLSSALLYLALLMPIVAPAQHHWLQAEPGVAAKKTAVRLTLLHGDKLEPKAGSDLPVITNFNMYQAKDSFSLSEARTGGTALINSDLVTETFLAAAELKLPDKTLLLPDLKKQFTKEQRAILARQDSSVINKGVTAERYHFVKTLVPVQNHRDKDKLYQRQLSHELEILLSTDPSQVKPGQHVVIQLLLHQRVLPYHKFTVWLQGKDGKTEVSENSTNKYGVRMLTVPKPGRYVVLVSQEGPHKIGFSDEVHWKSLQASYSFVIE